MIRLLCVVCTLLASPAFAEPQCGPRTAVADALAMQFGETVREMGLTGDARLMELYGNDKTGTWTAVITTDAGISCFAASGTAFKAVKPGVPS